MFSNSITTNGFLLTKDVIRKCSKRCTMGKNNFEKAPSLGYCASQGLYYYRYKFHAVCGLSGVIHFFDLTKASVHDIHYLKNLKVDYSNCTVIGDRGYLSAQV